MDTYQAILEGSAPNRLVWTGAPPPTGAPQPAHDTRNAVGRPFASRREPWLATRYENLDFTHVREGETDVFTWKTPQGTVTGRRVSNHMMEFPLKTLSDIPVWRYVRENTVYGEDPRFSGADRRKMGFKWSPVQELLQFVTGVENFYYFLTDAREEMVALMDAMHRKNLEALEIGIRACRAATVLQYVENTSASLISPAYYREHTLPHIRSYADLAHRHGKRFIVHMCGLLQALLDCFAETGMDGIHAVTPPPVGDTFYTDIRKRYGDGFTIIGRLSAQLWMGKDADAILAVLEDMIPESLVRTPFALWITSDEMRPSPGDVANLNQALENYNAEL